MSENLPIGLTVAEKIFGLILVIIGAIFTFYSINLQAGDISHFIGIFVFTGLVILAVGIFLIIVKTE